MFDLGLHSLGEIVVRTVAVYVALLALLRIAGKRELGQMTTFDLVVVLIIANAVQNAMVGPNTSLDAGILAAAVLIVLNWGVDRLGIRYAWLGRRLTGSPTLLINEGKIIPEHLRREGVTEEELAMACREHGVDGVSNVALAILEIDGTISIIPHSEGAAIRRARHDTHTRHRVRGRKPRT